MCDFFLCEDEDSRLLLMQNISKKGENNGETLHANSIPEMNRKS